MENTLAENRREAPMNTPSKQDSVALGISAAERETGLSKDTLRVWERRYGFPRPTRNEHGERLYPADQVNTLQLLKRLIDLGHRPAKIIALGNDQLRALLAARALDGAPAPAPHAKLAYYMEAVSQHRVETLRRRLEWALLEAGLARFVMEVVAPLNALVGEAWSRGELEIYEEHLYCETIETMLRHAVHTVPHADSSPRVLLTTLPGEIHGLGLLMVETLLTLEGCRCISLGPQTPRGDIMLAAGNEEVDIVALSFSSLARQGVVDDNLRWLREHLAPHVQLWAGGSGARQYATDGAQVVVFESLAEIQGAVERWRATHPAPRAA